MHYQYTPTKLSKMTKAKKCWWGYGVNGTLILTLIESKLIKTLENSQYLKAEHTHTLWPRVSSSRDLSYRNVTYAHPLTCTRMFLVALFVIAPNWKRHKSPCTTEEGSNTFWYSYTILHSSENEQSTTQQHKESSKYNVKGDTRLHSTILLMQSSK